MTLDQIQRITTYGACLERAQEESNDAIHSGNYIYWHTREIILKRLREEYPGTPLPQMLQQLFTSAGTYRRKSETVRMTESTWEDVAHPDLIIREVHDR